MRSIPYVLVMLFFLSGAQESIGNNAGAIKILVGTPVRQKPKILREFLFSLEHLEQNNITIDYFFIDDNDDVQSSELLKSFATKTTAHCLISSINFKEKQQFVCNEITHYWTDELTWKLASFKNLIIRHAIQEDYDYLFFIDSDIVLNPKTLEHLVGTGKDIISEIFWTRWTPESQELPQVWLYDFYSQNEEFIHALKNPGVYEVGGLGACTLISKKALCSGVNFNKVKNVSFWGEDRHFCIRAVVLGYSLFVDTYFPAYHIYRESSLDGLDNFKRNNNLPCATLAHEKGCKLTLSMCIKNEANRYLRQVLEAAKEYIDAAVIIDDASTDNSVEICQEVLNGIPLHIIRNTESKFTNETSLRQQQWNETIKTDPDWILVLDADEIFETNFKTQIAPLLVQDMIDVFYFRLYDFWDENHFREDPYWNAHDVYRPFLVRYKKDFTYQWNMQPLHCGRLPCNINELSGATTSLRLKHYGWSKADDRITKYHRYKTLDPNGTFGIMAQYESILDEHPNLIEWIE